MSLKNEDVGTVKFQWNAIRDDGGVDQGEAVYRDVSKEFVSMVIKTLSVVAGTPSSIISLDDDGEYKERL